MSRTLTIGLFLLLLAGQIVAQNTSSYTRLDEKNCRALKANADQGEFYVGMCKGLGGYRLRVTKGEEHQFVDLVTRSGKEYGVGFNSASYNFIGNTAEWRLQKGKPVALILRYNLLSPETGKVSSSMLVVSKITRAKACVTDLVDAGKTQNIDARKLADRSSGRPCRSNE